MEEKNAARREEVGFGEQVKRYREERGFTQQALAEKLYVTRQAVSRWECGARQPDLLTAKKLARIRDVSLDELLSGEKLREDIEQGAVSAGWEENMIQTALYAGVATIWLLLCLFSIYTLLGPNRPPASSPAGQITALSVAVDQVRLFYFGAAAAGLFLSYRELRQCRVRGESGASSKGVCLLGKSRLTAKVTGYILSVPCLSEAFLFLVTYLDMRIRGNGHMSFVGWATDFILPLGFAGCITLYFRQKEQKIPFGVILGICLFTAGDLVCVYLHKFRYFTDAGFASMTLGMAGKLGMAALLGYQAFIWRKRCRAGILLPAPYPVDQALPVHPPVHGAGDHELSKEQQGGKPQGLPERIVVGRYRRKVVLLRKQVDQVAEEVAQGHGDK